MLLVEMCIYGKKKKKIPKPVVSNLIVVGTLFWNMESMMDSMKLQESGLFCALSVGRYSSEITKRDQLPW